jgi:hypothetical protein
MLGEFGCQITYRSTTLILKSVENADSRTCVLLLYGDVRGNILLSAGWCFISRSKIMFSVMLSTPEGSSERRRDFKPRSRLGRIASAGNVLVSCLKVVGCHAVNCIGIVRAGLCQVPSVFVLLFVCKRVLHMTNGEGESKQYACFGPYWFTSC